MKTLLSAVALFGLLLVAGAGNPAAASDNQRREAPIGAPAWNPNQPDNGQVELHYVHDSDDDDYDRRHDQRYNPWPYNGNGWNNNGNNNWNNGWNNNGWNNNNWNNGWNNNWNNQPPQYQQPVRGQPLPRHVVVFKLKQHHFYNVGEIKAKKGYYRIYAKDRWGRPVEVIMNPYTGRILRVGTR